MSSQIYEQSRFANETGAAVHLAPNSNGVLKRWGILAEEFGAVRMDRIQERLSPGSIMKDVDCTVPNKQWQHSWLLSHRVNLHEKLKSLATSEDGAGPPAKLHTSSKVASLDPEKGEIKLVDGTTVAGDVVLGADGIYVRTRTRRLSVSGAKLTSCRLVQVKSVHQGRKVVWLWQGGLPVFVVAGGLPQ